MSRARQIIEAEAPKQVLKAAAARIAAQRCPACDEDLTRVHMVLRKFTHLRGRRIDTRLIAGHYRFGGRWRPDEEVTVDLNEYDSGEDFCGHCSAKTLRKRKDIEQP